MAGQGAQAAAFAQLGAIMKEQATALQSFIAASNQRHAALETQVKGFAELLEKTPANKFQQRAPATGGNADTIKTDC